MFGKFKRLLDGTKKKKQKNKRLRRELAAAREELARLKERAGQSGIEQDAFPADRVVWIFGAGRTGSTWLSAMMGEMPGHTVWFEPMLGELFDPERLQVGVRPMREFVFAEHRKPEWSRLVRNFVLGAAGARFPKHPKILVIKEPHGSAGAPMLSDALPESRFVLLVRDPRDAVASALGRYLDGSWKETGGFGMYRGPKTTPNGFIERAARSYLRHVSAAKRAYNTHKGPKCMIRYEDLRADTLQEMRLLYYEIAVPITESALEKVVEKHRFENLATGELGRGKVARKATVGSYLEDLSAPQIEMVERITAPLLREFYTGRS